MNCLFVACSGGQRWKHSCGCQRDVWIFLSLSLSCSLSLSICLSHFCVHVRVCLCVCVCQCAPWGIMADQTWLCGRCKFNHNFFSQHISESDSVQVLRPIKWTHIERDVFVHARPNIYMCGSDACVTGMSVILKTCICKIRETQRSGALLLILIGSLLMPPLFACET